MTNTKLIYICGMGHNGSTALDLLLDLSGNCLGTSQLNDLLVLYDPYDNNNGRPDFVNQFWSEVVNNLSDSNRELLKSENHSVFKEKALLPFIFSKKLRTRYASVNRFIIDQVIEKADGRAIVDSSKNVSRALGLLQLDGDAVDIYVLHLTRDVRGYVESHNKRRKEINLRPRYVVPTLVWFAKNATASLFVKPRARNYLHVRYEEMMLKPEQFLLQLGDFFGVSLKSCGPALRGETPLQPANSLGFLGNRVLAQRKDVLLDSKRIKKDGLFSSFLYWCTLGWLSCFWGYRFKP